MWGSVFTVCSLISLCFYLYGVLITISYNEKNACKMTYMYEYPQFVVSSFFDFDLIILFQIIINICIIDGLGNTFWNRKNKLIRKATYYSLTYNLGSFPKKKN